MAHSVLIIQVLFGIIGNVTSFVLSASPVPIFYGIIKNKSVDEVKPGYYLTTTFNCLFWMLYAMPFINPGRLLVLTANAIGLAIQLPFLIIFLIYAKDSKQRMYVGGVFLIELVLIGLVSGLVIGLAHTILARTAVIGGFCFASASLMHTSHIYLTVDVCKTKRVENMSFILALSLTLNDLCWLIYASLSFDNILWANNFVGFIIGVIQLILYSVGYKSTPILPISGDDS